MAGVRGIAWLVPRAAKTAALDWEAVYREEMPRIYNFFRYRVGDGPGAEDLTSATFEKAWRARDRYRRDRASVATWLFAIARNVATDYFRKDRREVPLEEAGDLGGTSPETSLVQRADSRRLSALLADLPERDRELLALKYGAGATNRAIAKLTGLGESNVGTILHRVVAALRARWAESGEGP
jgi:RNA polymerase sigma-70 factor (ECF subfamily)